MAEITPPVEAPDGPPAAPAAVAPAPPAPQVPGTDKTYEQSASEFMTAMHEHDAATGDGQQPPKKNSFLKNLFTTGIFGLVGHAIAHPIDTLQAVEQGAATAVTETAKTVGTLAAAPLVGMEASQKSAAKLVAPIENFRDAYFGPRSDNSGDEFVRSTAQFMTGFLGANELKLGSFAIKSLPALLRGGVAGGIAQGAAFDPHEAQWSEWASTSGIPGIETLGKITLPSPQDGEIAARAKRALGGLLPGVAVDGLLGVWHSLTAAKLLHSATATAAEREAAATTLEQNGKMLQAIKDGTYVPDAPAVVRPTANGKFEIVPNETVINHMAAQLPKDATGMPVRTPEQIVAEEARRGTSYADLQAQDEAARAEQLTFDTQWEAEQHAASINQAVGIRFDAAAAITDEQVNAIRGLATKIEESGGDLTKLPEIVQPPQTNFNFTYLDTPEKTNALLKALDQTLSPAFEKARAAGGISWEQSMERTRQAAGMLPREELMPFVRSMSSVIKNADVAVHFIDSQMTDLTGQASKAAAILEQRPFDAVAQGEARAAVQRLFDMSAERLGTSSGLGRGLNALNNSGELTDLAFKGEPGAISSPDLAGGTHPAPPVTTGTVLDRMSPAQLRDFMQLFRLSDNPSVLLNTAAKTLDPATGGFSKGVGGFFQVFYNAVLSHAATWGGIFTDIAGVSAYEDGVRALAGFHSGDTELVRSAADILRGRGLYLKNSVKGMGMAFKAGRSIIDPQPIRHAIPVMADLGITSMKDALANPKAALRGLPGEIINTLGSRPIASLEEFWRTNNVFSKTYADAAALARRDAPETLTGKALDDYVSQRAQEITAASIDPETGASRLPASRSFARYRSLMSPLEQGSFGQKVEAAAADHPLLRGIMPFVRMTFNSTDMAFVKNSPLGLFSKQYKAAIEKGGPDAAIMQTRMAVGSTLWGLGALAAFEGGITGAGPSNPKVRAAWLAAGNRPYSLQGAGMQVSYRRFEPFATMLSTTADIAGVLRDHSQDAEINAAGAKVFYAVLAGTADAFANKTYLSSLTKFMEAATSGEGGNAKAFLDQYLAAGVPGEIAAFNSDPYVRQTKGMFDAFINQVPGWSRSLPPVYNGFGEPILSSPSRTQRLLNPFPVAKQPDEFATPESEQVDMGRALAVPPTIERYGQYNINLHDPQYRNKNGGTDTPYETWMQYIEAGNLRGRVQDMINSTPYQHAGTGNVLSPGGERFRLLQTLMNNWQTAARLTMLQEYPRLQSDLIAARLGERVTKFSDQAGGKFLQKLTP